MPREPKLQRWTDLMAALLRRNFPVTFDDLARDVPAYQTDKKKDAIMRMFERDKDELRAFGISIETVPSKDEGEAAGYRLDKKGFYLPYLSLAASEGKAGSAPRKVDKYGYRALASLVFEPDELHIVAEAAQRVRALGDPVLAEEAESAIRKLSFDLPIPAAEERADQVIAMMRPIGVYETVAARENVFETVNDALVRRKALTFTYNSISSDTVAQRHAEPYGLFFLSAHWYMAARDRDKNELRNFRLSRMSNVEVNRLRAQSSDYEIPSGFNLREHAQSRKPWDLGEGDRNKAIVEFRGSSGATKAAARLGEAIEGSDERRQFRFRRVDSFARWLLSLGGEAIPLSPDSLVAEFNSQLNETRAVYKGTT